MRWLAADEVAAWARRPVSAVYLLAHRHGWRRIRHNGKTYYNPSDAEHTIMGLTKQDR